MNGRSPSPVRFGFFEFDPVSGELRRRGLLVRLTPQARSLLGILLEPPIRMRTREEIRALLWPANVYVDFERGMNKAVHYLRAALGETAHGCHYIETVAGGGYRFVPQLVDQGSWNGRMDPPAPARCLAVLPITSDPEPELVSLGRRLTSHLIEGLALIPGVRVIAESTIRSQKLEGLSPQLAGATLGARALLSGELARHNSDLRLRTELVDSADGTLLCAARVERPFESHSHCEGELAQAILCQIQPRLHYSALRKKLPRSEPAFHRMPNETYLRGF